MSEHHGFEPPAAGEAADEVVAPAETAGLDDAVGFDDVDGSHDESAEGEVLVLDTWQIQLPATGDAAVDAALARLTEVEGLAPAAHPEVYEAVHTGLQEALADLDRA